MPKLAGTDWRFRHRAQRAGARRGALGEPDVGADRTQSAGGAGQYRAQYRQHRGGGEVSAQRKPSDIFPTFLALNSNGAVNQGYLSGKYAPFKVTPTTAGISNTTNATGQTRFENRFKLLNSLDGNLRTERSQRRGNGRLQRVLRRRQAVDVQPDGESVFRLHRAESERYGNSAALPRATPCWWPRRY